MNAAIEHVKVALRAGIVLAVVAYILDVHGRLGIGLFTEQMLVTVLGLSLALTFLTFPLGWGETGEEAVAKARALATRCSAPKRSAAARRAAIAAVTSSLPSLRASPRPRQHPRRRVAADGPLPLRELRLRPRVPFGVGITAATLALRHVRLRSSAGLPLGAHATASVAPCQPALPPRAAEHHTSSPSSARAPSESSPPLPRTTARGSPPRGRAAS